VISWWRQWWKTGRPLDFLSVWEDEGVNSYRKGKRWCLELLL
jgi:hypothetical protein